jgi:hypothetical protein
MFLARRRCRSELHARVGLERLEDRCTPATVSLIGSTLTVSNPRLMVPSTSLQVNQLADGRFQVLDAGFNSGIYAGVSNIVINGSNYNDKISVTLAAGKSLAGYLTINGNNGNDVVTIDGTNGTETIGGNVSLDLGYGDDAANIGTTNGLTIAGNTSITGGYGNDSATIGNTAGAVTTLRGNLGVSSTQTLKIGQGHADAVRGNLTMDLKLTPTLFESNSISLFTGATSTIGGTLQVTGGVFNDSVTLGGTSIGPNTGMVSHSINLGEGSNTLSLNTQVFGDLAYTGGAGTDSVSITAASLIFGTGGFGNLTLNMGDGSNVYNLNTAFSVSGNLTINAGFPAQIITLGASVGGNLNVNLGDGDNQFTLNGTVGATFNYNVTTPSNGNNIVTINTGTNTFNVNIRFGPQTAPTPNNQLILGGTGKVTGTVDWGEFNLGDDVFSPGAVDITGLTQIGLP